MKMGDKHFPSMLAAGAKAYVTGKNACEQLNLITKIVIEKSSYFKKYELRAKPKKLELWNLANDHNRFPTLVVLRAADGSTDHSVVIVNGLVFDRNTGNAMKLSKATLDWSCNCEDGYVGALYALRFWH